MQTCDHSLVTLPLVSFLFTTPPGLLALLFAVSAAEGVAVFFGKVVGLPSVRHLGPRKICL